VVKREAGIRGMVEVGETMDARCMGVVREVWRGVRRYNRKQQEADVIKRTKPSAYDDDI
jgi:hypothetical protein